MPLSLLQTLRSYLLRSPILLFLGFVALVLPIVLLRSFQSTVHFGARQDNAPRVCVCPMVITASTMQIYCLDEGVVRKWGFSLENDSEDYGDSKASSSSIQTDAPDDYDSYEINELEDATRKTYHCAARNSIRNETNLDRRVIEVLDDNGIPSLQAKRLHYQAI
ncbi:hypothetical protein G9C98_002207 [Cotesia typhae]|uniref:Uncharacterized protein n=1 Tax=Cotesia typhae TaxID=2053667 RepID=A0A8J5R9G1_9HYME|nr:hypothetical protein G9C98_002207 [Cotesia typhae]